VRDGVPAADKAADPGRERQLAAGAGAGAPAVPSDAGMEGGGGADPVGGGGGGADPVGNATVCFGARGGRKLTPGVVVPDLTEPTPSLRALVNERMDDVRLKGGEDSTTRHGD